MIMSCKESKTKPSKAECTRTKRRALGGPQRGKAPTFKSKQRVQKCKSLDFPISLVQAFGGSPRTDSDLKKNMSENMFVPRMTRRTRSSGKSDVSQHIFDAADMTPDTEVDLFTLYSGGCMTRGQMNKVKQIFGEPSNFEMKVECPVKRKSKLVVKKSLEHNLELIQEDSPETTILDMPMKMTRSQTIKTKLKRKREVLNEPAKSPEKKACKSSIGSVISARTAIVPKSDAFEQKPATRRGLFTQNSRLPTPNDDCESFPSNNYTKEAISAPTTPTRSLYVPDGTDDWLHRFLRWSAKDKIHVLDNLINVCQPHEVRHMLEIIEPQFQRDFISLLPKELALYVLSFLEPRDLLMAAQTCKYWRILAEDNLMWREKCMEEGIQEPYVSKVIKNSWKSKKNNAIGVCSAWKAAYLRQVRIEMNWRDGNEKISKVLKGHDDHVITCLQFNGSRIVSGSDDNTLKVWSAVSGKCLRTLTGHTGGVWASQMRKNLIISGSTDRTLKIWNSDTGACVHTLYGHTSTVRCLALHENIVVSGSRDATLRVWDIDTGACLHVLMGHMAAVRCVCYDGRKVVSGAYDYMIKVWDPETEECLHTLQGHTNRVYSLQFDGTYVVSGSLDTSIRVWEVETGTCLHTLMGHQSLTSGMELKNNILVSGNADSTVKVWDILTGECLKTLEGTNKHLSAVTCLQFHGKFVITSSDDGTVKLWDIKTGKVIRDLVTLESRGSGGVVWRIRASQTKLVCAVGSRNGTEETKLLVLDFDPDTK
ncbi:unnamed protein product [Clavelina lepadiformis]|uniref:F-box domain-containing protein n=1 Tax=Clavelina lepadiformis TaxID=159417 RepID=A0ABP0GZB8_CLALP